VGASSSRTKSMLTFSIICPSVEFSANRDSVAAKNTFAQPPDEIHALTRTEPQTLEQFFRERAVAPPSVSLFDPSVVENMPTA